MKHFDGIHRGNIALSIFMLIVAGNVLPLKSAAVAQTEAIKAPPEVLACLPTKIDELAYVKVPEASNVYVVSYNFRGEEAVGQHHSAIMVINPRGPGNSPAVLWKSKDENLYAPKVTLEKNFLYRGKPIIMVNRFEGAGWQHLDIIGIHNHQPRLLDKKEAMKFELLPRTRSEMVMLVAYQRKYLTPLPSLFQWQGEKFSDVSNQNPQYYDNLLRKGFHFLDSDDKPLEIAIMTKRAGRQEEAVRQLEKLLVEEENRGSKANIKRINAIEDELESLKK